ncbi:MAG: hypothetical protein E7122_08685 [Bacteroidales bacterium]|nr:hypothetical protein [Bacteroidales bacterium]
MKNIKNKNKSKQKLKLKKLTKSQRHTLLILAVMIYLFVRCLEYDVIRFRLAINGEITSGIIYEKKTWHGKGGQRYNYKYKFYVDGNMYTGETVYADKPYKDTRIGDTIPVMYLPHKREITDSYNAVARSGGISFAKLFK